MKRSVNSLTDELEEILIDQLRNDSKNYSYSSIFSGGIDSSYFQVFTRPLKSRKFCQLIILEKDKISSDLEGFKILGRY